MEESLKTARGTHHLSLLLCAALVLLVFTGDTRAKYEAALVELRVLQSVKAETYEPYIERVLASTAVPHSKKFWVDNVRLIAEQHGFSVTAKDPHPADRLNRTASHIPVDVMDALQTGSLFGFDEALSGDSWNRKINLDVPDLEALTSELRNFFVTYKRAHPDLPVLTNIDIGATAAVLEFRDGSGREETETVYYEPEAVPVDRSSVVDWLRSTYPDLVDTKGGWLPAIKQFWGELAPLTVQNAVTRVRDLRSQPQGDLEFLGLKINRSAALFVGPLLLVALVVVLTQHTAHLRRLVRTDPGKYAPEVAQFPWEVLYPGPLVPLARSFTLLIFPALVYFSLLVQFHRSLQPYHWTVLGPGLIALIAAGILAVRLARDVSRIAEKQLTAPAEPERESLEETAAK